MDRRVTVIYIVLTVLLVGCSSKTTSNNSNTIIEKSANVEETISTDSLLTALSDMKTAYSVVHDIWSYTEEWIRHIANKKESEQKRAIQSLIAKIDNTKCSSLSNKENAKEIESYKKDIIKLLSNNAQENYIEYLDSIYSEMKKKLFIAYPYNKYCSLEPDTFWLYIDKNRYLQPPSYDSIMRMNKEDALKQLIIKTKQLAVSEEKIVCMLTCGDLFYYTGNVNKAIKEYQKIIEQDYYSHYLAEAWVKWRCLTQCQIGISRDAEIPNELYNNMRNSMLNTIYKQIKKAPKDQMAINQFCTMASYPNLARNEGTMFGNGATIEMMNLFPIEEE